MPSDAEPKSTAEVSDRDLLQRIRQGDSLAEGMLFDRYYRRLVGYVHKKESSQLRRMDSPSDLANSVMKSAFRRIPDGQYDVAEGKTLWPLLTKIAIHKIANLSRKHRASELPEMDLPSPGASPEEEAIVNEFLERLQQKLGERRWQIFRLFLDRWRIQEIAELSGVTERTVYNTRKDAEEYVQELLDEHQADASEG